MLPESRPSGDHDAIFFERTRCVLEVLYVVRVDEVEIGIIIIIIITMIEKVPAPTLVTTAIMKKRLVHPDLANSRLCIHSYE